MKRILLGSRWLHQGINYMKTRPNIKYTNVCIYIIYIGVYIHVYLNTNLSILTPTFQNVVLSVKCRYEKSICIEIRDLFLLKQFLIISKSSRPKQWSFWVEDSFKHWFYLKILMICLCFSIQNTSEVHLPLCFKNVNEIFRRSYFTLSEIHFTTFLALKLVLPPSLSLSLILILTENVFAQLYS